MQYHCRECFHSGNGVISTGRVQVLENLAPSIHTHPFGLPPVSTTVRLSHPIPFLLPPLNSSPDLDSTAVVHLAYLAPSDDSRTSADSQPCTCHTPNPFVSSLQPFPLSQTPSRRTLHPNPRRYRGSLSRRDLGLNETSPFAVTVTKEFPREGRWWDPGLPVAPRPKWGTLRVENEEARSRHRALSLADLIRTGQQKSDDDGGGGRAGNPRASLAPAEGGGGGVGGTSPTWKAKGRGAGSSGKGRINAIGIDSTGGGGRHSNSTRVEAGGTVVATGIGFSKGASTRRAASMVDPREAEKAALMDEIERRRARRTAVAPPFNTLSIVEKHQHRERVFQEQREKRRAAAERETRRKVSLSSMDSE